MSSAGPRGSRGDLTPVRRKGAAVIVADLQTDAGVTIAEAIGGAFFALDVGADEGWDRLMSLVETMYGRLDVVFTNAGVVSGQLIEDVDLATWHRVIGVNLTGVMLGCRRGVAAMRRDTRYAPERSP